jgi:hypothetical protein
MLYVLKNEKPSSVGIPTLFPTNFLFISNEFPRKRENNTRCLPIYAVAINFTVGIVTLMKVVCAQKIFGTFIDRNVKMTLTYRLF